MILLSLVFKYAFDYIKKLETLDLATEFLTNLSANSLF